MKSLDLTCEGLPPGGELIKGAAIAVATLISEDATTLSASLLAAAQEISWATAFWGTFLGIWLGDAMLYGLARCIGRPLLDRSWLGKWVNRDSIRKSEDWFAERGTALLFSCRFVPGTRLPTYLAAGFLKISIVRFILITGVMALTWTAGVFWIVRSFGDEVLAWFERWRIGLFGIIATTLVAWLVLRTAVRCRNPGTRQRVHGWVGRWTRWEFWPPWLFYLPVAVWYVLLSIRHRSFLAPTAANPRIFSGGFVGESKMEMLDQLLAVSPSVTARSWLLPSGNPVDRLFQIAKLREHHGLQMPFILKPDVGQRGVGVKLIRDEGAVREYLDSCSDRLVVQDYAPGPCEAGIFYVRKPDERSGRIFAITKKIFPELIGDGVRTVEELIWQGPRSRFMAAKYLARLSHRRDEVLGTGARLRLVEAGNHAQGCIFEDGMHLCTPELEQRIDEISRSLPEFYCGRYDVRYAADADLMAGRGFTIVELNGAASEATSIYDPRNSLFAAYRTLFQQWRLVFEIGAENMRRGAGATPAGVLLSKWRESRAAARVRPVAD